MRVTLSVSLGLVALFGGSVASAHAKAPPSGPHLLVTSVKAAPDERKPFHRFLNGPDFHLVVTIKNTGTARVSRNGMHEGVLLSKSGGALAFAHETNFEIPRVGAGRTVAVEVDASGVGFRNRDRITTAFARACAPVRGNAHFNSQGALDDRQNCAKGPEFAVIPRHWGGTMSVTHTIFGYAKMETDATPRFTYSAPVSEHNKEFVYGGVGSLVHSVSGANAFCSIAGGKNGTIGPAEGFLVLDPDLLSYRGGMRTSETYLSTQTCNGNPVPTPIRTDGIQIPSKNIDLGDTKLQGSADGIGGITFKWDIDAEP